MKKGQSKFTGFPNWNIDKENNINEKIIKNIVNPIHEFSNFKKTYDNGANLLNSKLGCILLIWMASFVIVLKIAYYIPNMNSPKSLSIYLFVLSILYCFIYFILCKHLIFKINRKDIDLYKELFNKSLDQKLIDNEDLDVISKKMEISSLHTDKTHNERKIELIEFLINYQNDIKVAIITIIATIISAIFISFGSLISKRVDTTIIQPSFEENRPGSTIYEIYNSEMYESEKDLEKLKSDYKIVNVEYQDRMILQKTITLFFIILLVTCFGFVIFSFTSTSYRYKYYKILESIKYDLI